MPEGDNQLLDLTQPLFHNCPGWPDYDLPRFELRGRSEPLDIWCVPAIERVSL